MPTQERQSLIMHTMPELKILHVGCGAKNIAKLPKPFRSPQWQEVRLDINPDVKPDIIGTMTDMKEADDAEFDAVYSSHNIEHLYPYEVEIALKEFSRVLKPRGFCVITCPDLQAVAQLVVEDKLTEPAYQSPAGPISPIDMLYGHRPQLARGNHYMAHRCGFTARVLANSIVSAGFSKSSATRYPSAFALWAIGTKYDCSENEMADLRRDYFP
jgi:SAM-dependent methyltransferase